MEDEMLRDSFTKISKQWEAYGIHKKKIGQVHCTYP